MQRKSTAHHLAVAPPASSVRAEPPSSPRLPTFTPVPRRYRSNGWTPEREQAFIETPRKASPCAMQGDTWARQGDGLRCQGDTFEPQGDGLRLQGDGFGPSFPWTLSHPSLCPKGGEPMIE